MGVTVLDAGVVIAVLDPADAHHAAAAVSFRDARTQPDAKVLLPASAYAEVLVHPARAGAAAFDLARRFCSEQLRLEPLSGEIAEAAARLRAVHTALRLPDALVIATAEVAGAERLLTTDRRWREYSSVAEILSQR
jgi:predicted nucleic acid-binding protein